MSILTLPFRSAAVLACLLLAAPAPAELRPVPVAEGVWALVGAKGQRSPENLGNNATFGLIVTEAGAVLIDAGGDIIGSVEVDQSAFARLDQFDTLAGRKAQQAFTEMESE